MRPNSPPAAEALQPDIFPLPLTPFETYYYLDDCEAYPTTFPLELRFTGTLDANHFRTALEQTVARHPMLRAVVNAQSRAWVAAQVRPEIDWADAAVPVSHPHGERMDLSAAPGLRTWVRVEPGRARVLFQFHHGCCDGLSALQFVRDFLAAYKLATGAGGELPLLDPRLLLRRGDLLGPDDPRPSFVENLLNANRTRRVWWDILFHTPRPLEPPRGSHDRQAQGELLAFGIQTFDRQESARLRQVAVDAGTTVNDLLLRDFLLALDRWNTEQGADRGTLRVNVPINVRRKDEVRMPAANRIGFGFVAATPAELADAGKLLAAVKRQTQRIKDWKLGLYFLGGLAFAGGLPPLLRWVLARNNSFATAVLSNVGRFVPEPSMSRDERWRCGDLILESILGVPPLRKLTRAAVIVVDYAGEFTICLRADPHYFETEQTRALLGLFTAQVRTTLL